jgi:hypothetical protein
MADIASSSESSSFAGNEGDGILPLLEGFIKRGDLMSIK